MAVGALSVVFRVDASRQLGSGHVMRCLTLADALEHRGARVLFVCRGHDGHLEPLIRARGFEVIMLVTPEARRIAAAPAIQGAHLAPSDWLGVEIEVDAEQFSVALDRQDWDWIIVDHYALNHRWESKARPLAKHLMVIDDLADRDHDCDLLLDQNLGREEADYQPRVKSDCRLLMGPTYALLRSEFAELRVASLTRRRTGEMTRILISMGGVDLPNATGRVLDVLAYETLVANTKVLVVMGQNAPWLGEIQNQVARLPFFAEVRVGIDDMARQMSDCDLAIGAAGGTAWERCCLGVPSILVVLADNQRPGAQALERAGAALVIESVDDIATDLPRSLEKLRLMDNLMRMQDAASNILDGQGAQKVVDAMEMINVS